MTKETCQAIVLSCLDYGETDRVVGLFTLEHGRLKGFAKSARASRKRFGGLLEPGNRLEVTLAVKEEGLSRLERVEPFHGGGIPRDCLESLALALYGCELVELLTPEGQPYPRLFRLLCALLEHLAGTHASLSDRRFFEINLLNILGYRPPLEDERLRPLQNCLRTGKFGGATLPEEALLHGGRLLDAAIAGHAAKAPKSLGFLTDLLK